MTVMSCLVTFKHRLMKRDRVLRGTLWLVVFALSGLPFTVRQSAEASSEAQSETPERLQPVDSELAVDFDGDHIPDLAVGRNDGPGYTVRVQFTSKLPSTSLTLPEGGPGIRIFSSDVDKDSRPDIVVTSATSQFPIAIWLCDENGGFHAANPWSYFPCHMDTPFSYEPTQSGDDITGISEDGRICGIQPNTDSAIVALRARDWLASRPVQAPPCNPPGDIPPRGPPSAVELQVAQG